MCTRAFFWTDPTIPHFPNDSVVAQFGVGAHICVAFIPPRSKFVFVMIVVRKLIFSSGDVVVASGILNLKTEAPPTSTSRHSRQPELLVYLTHAHLLYDASSRPGLCFSSSASGEVSRRLVNCSWEFHFFWLNRERANFKNPQYWLVTSEQCIELSTSIFNNLCQKSFFIRNLSEQYNTSFCLLSYNRRKLLHSAGRLWGFDLNKTGWSSMSTRGKFAVLRHSQLGCVGKVKDTALEKNFLVCIKGS